MRVRYNEDPYHLRHEASTGGCVSTPRREAIEGVVTLPTSGLRATEEQARRFDAEDALSGFKSRFYIPNGKIYMDGNSLGLMSRDAESSLTRVLEEWKRLGIDGWLSARPPWFEYGERLGARVAAIVGADPERVVVTGSTTINLHALALTFLREMPGKNVLADRLNFPSDLYALAGDTALTGGRLKMVDSEDGRFLDEAEIIRAMTPDVGLAVLPSVLYRSGQLLDMPRLARAARERRIILGFDCSHSAGAVPHHFDEWDLDFAFWCSYKYLNGGPGATAVLYLSPRHWAIGPALPGWWGHRKDTQFEMRTEYDQAPAAGAWQVGTPNILGTAALWGAMEVISEAGIERIRAKSLRQTAYLICLIDEMLAPLGFSVGTPREDGRRGGHVALEHKDAWRVCAAMKERGVIPDFRPPDVMRLAPSPLYTSFVDIWNAVDAIGQIVKSGSHLAMDGHPRSVT